ALEPDARKRTMRITAEAKTSDDMIAYVEQLKQQELFAAVVLTRHEINDQDPNKPIRFQLDAQWTAP
ncbi:MAG TPA: PilN domain-containing protein, partial [Telluria sp.]|nr:PilN domain-containing protein [Telluria sp.]